MSEPTPAEVARMESDAKEQAEAYREQVAEAERQAAAEDRTETLLFADRQAGSPLSEMTRARSALAEVQDQVADLEDRLSRAKAKLSRAQSNHSFWAERLATAQGSVERSAQRNPFEVARAEATEAFRKHEAYKRNTEAAWRAAKGPSQRRRPFTAGAAVSSNGQHPQAQHKRLTDYGFGESTPDGCPPCDRCNYVWCRCADGSGGTARAAGTGYYEITRGTESAVMSVR